LRPRAPSTLPTTPLPLPRRTPARGSGAPRSSAPASSRRRSPDPTLADHLASAFETTLGASPSTATLPLPLPVPPAAEPVSELLSRLSPADIQALVAALTASAVSPPAPVPPVMPTAYSTPTLSADSTARRHRFAGTVVFYDSVPSFEALYGIHFDPPPSSTPRAPPSVATLAQHLDVATARDALIASWHALRPASDSVYTAKLAEAALLLDFDKDKGLTRASFTPVHLRASPATFQSLYFDVLSLGVHFGFLGPHFATALTALFTDLAAQAADLPAGYLPVSVMTTVIDRKLLLFAQVFRSRAPPLPCDPEDVAWLTFECLQCPASDPLLLRLIQEAVGPLRRAPSGKSSSAPPATPKAPPRGGPSAAAPKLDIPAMAKQKGLQRGGSASSYDSNVHYSTSDTLLPRPESCLHEVFPCIAHMRGDPCPAAATAGLSCCRAHDHGSLSPGAYADLVAYVKAAKSRRL
jgi:hypothetical protein